MAAIAKKWRPKLWLATARWNKMEEFEIKFLEVDVPELEKKLLAIGAKKVGEYNYHRVLLDYPDFRMNKEDSWLRLRTNGKETTLAYKQGIVNIVDNQKIYSGMKEIETAVDSYEKTLELFKCIGLIVKREEENKRIRYRKGDSVFDIDFWPQIPPYLEVESTSLDKARDAAKELGLDPQQGIMCSAGNIYKKYGYTDDYVSMTFNGFIEK